MIACVCVCICMNEINSEAEDIMRNGVRDVNNKLAFNNFA